MNIALKTIAVIGLVLLLAVSGYLKSPPFQTKFKHWLHERKRRG